MRNNAGRASFLRLSIVILNLACAVCGADQPGSATQIPPAVYRRTAFLGDSITDGNTYPQLVRDALAEAGLPKMIAINAGIGGDTAAGMHARLERDVLVFHPTLVTLSVGANDAMRNVSPESYEKDVRAIAQRLEDEHIPLIILTPNILGPKQRVKGQKNLDAYEPILRRIAQEHGLRLAEVNARQKQDMALGHEELAPDDVHPNWRGQTMIARAVLDAMGYDNLKVLQQTLGKPLPGLIAEWRLKRIEDPKLVLTEASVADVKADASWIGIKLPDEQPIPDADSNNRWLDDYRKMGAAVVSRQQPPGSYLGLATLQSDKSAMVQFHTGADLQEVWLNGKRIYQNEWKRGYHIGRESVAAQLKQGENQIVIKTGAVFFLSVTAEPMWDEKE